MKKLVLILLAIICLIVIVFSCDAIGIGQKSEPIEIVISESDNLSLLSQRLQDEKVILNDQVFKLYYRFAAKSDIIYPGRITIHKNDSYHQIIKAISSPKIDTVTFTIPEGFEVREIVARLFQNGLIGDKNDFYTALNNYSFTTNQGSTITGEIASLSGFLFPDTYNIPKKTTNEEIIRVMTDNFVSKWTDEFQQKADTLGMSVEEVVNLASIIEREARKTEDFPMVASVFHNRLKIGKHLESCATVQYVLKERKPILTYADTEIDSPYNTYQNPGLPPAPISSPGLLAIEAVLNPAKTEYLYFFTDKNGDNHYSKTFEEHNQLITKYGL